MWETSPQPPRAPYTEITCRQITGLDGKTRKLWAESAGVHLRGLRGLRGLQGAGVLHKTETGKRSDRVRGLRTSA